jgi:hypothetical protein
MQGLWPVDEIIDLQKDNIESQELRLADSHISPYLALSLDCSVLYIKSKWKQQEEVSKVFFFFCD